MLLVTFYFVVGRYRASTREIDLTGPLCVLFTVLVIALVAATTFKVTP